MLISLLIGQLSKDDRQKVMTICSLRRCCKQDDPYWGWFKFVHRKSHAIISQKRRSVQQVSTLAATLYEGISVPECVCVYLYKNCTFLRPPLWCLYQCPPCVFLCPHLLLCLCHSHCAFLCTLLSFSFFLTQPFLSLLQVKSPHCHVRWSWVVHLPQTCCDFLIILAITVTMVIETKMLKTEN